MLRSERLCTVVCRPTWLYLQVRRVAVAASLGANGPARDRAASVRLADPCGIWCQWMTRCLRCEGVHSKDRVPPHSGIPLLFALSSLIRGFLLSLPISSHILLWFRAASLHLSCLFSDLAIPPFSGQPGHTVRLANFLLLYALAFLSSCSTTSLCSSPSLSLPFFLLLLSQPLPRL